MASPGIENHVKNAIALLEKSLEQEPRQRLQSFAQAIEAMRIVGRSDADAVMRDREDEARVAFTRMDVETSYQNFLKTNPVCHNYGCTLPWMHTQLFCGKPNADMSGHLLYNMDLEDPLK